MGSSDVASFAKQLLEGKSFFVVAVVNFFFFLNIVFVWAGNRWNWGE